MVYTWITNYGYRKPSRVQVKTKHSYMDPLSFLRTTDFQAAPTVAGSLWSRHTHSAVWIRMFITDPRNYVGRSRRVSTADGLRSSKDSQIKSSRAGGVPPPQDALKREVSACTTYQ